MIRAGTASARARGDDGNQEEKVPDDGSDQPIVDDDDDDASVAGGGGSASSEEDSNVRIFLRVKPSKKPSGFFTWDEDASQMKYDIPRDVAAGLINNSRTSYKFRFDAVLGMVTKQDEVFDRVGRPCVLNALNGFNSTVFAYGQTGSGKTFTITGGAERYEDRGLIPRAISMIFEEMKRQPARELRVHVSYLEIYNNQGYDLLDPNHEHTKSLEDLPRVAMLEDEDGNCHLRNLSMHAVNSEEDALNLLFLGDTNRAVSETAMNLTSSRSHCVFTLALELRREAGSEVVLRSKLHMIDLAGSERAHKTGAKGQVLREAAYINTSLHYLEMVIVALHERATKGRGHIPYRNSMLTSVLRDSLGGNCKTVMVATVSPEREQTDESVSTCRFAQRVARVRNDARLNEEVDPAVIIRQLKAQVASLQEELAIARGDVKEGDELKDYERDKLRVRCVEYANDADPSAFLNMGEFTYTKMRECFAILKSLAGTGGGDGRSGGGPVGSAPPGGTIVAGAGNQELEQRIAELEQLVQQRDNEIAIMVNMIRNGNGEVPESLANRSAASVMPVTATAPGNPSAKKAVKPPDASTFQLDPATLDDPAKAFEAFKAHYPKNDAIRDNKIALKKKYDAAKELANSVNDARNQIKTLTTQMDKLRKQQAIADEGLLDTSTANGDERKNADTQEAELKLKEQIDHNKAVYKKGFAELSELKKEIQHIQKMLEMGRLKLQKEFDLWYQRQGKGALLTEALVAQPKEGTTPVKDPPDARSDSRNAMQSSKHSASPRDSAATPVKSSSPTRPPSARLRSDGSSSSLVQPVSEDVRKPRSVRSSISSSIATTSTSSMTPRSSIARYESPKHNLNANIFANNVLARAAA